MSGAYGWQRLVGVTVEPGYRLRELVRHELRMATFAGLRESSGDACLITLVRCATDECESYVRRFMEAKFLRHPNLMAVLDAGAAHLGEIDVAFIVTEPANYSLHTAERLEGESLWQLCRDLVAGLAYLHSENLVYCVLRDETIMRVGDSWKLGDFHQLRLGGSGRARETRGLMGRMPEIPPEAFEGVVTPAWDVWSFGVTLGKVLRHRSDTRRTDVSPEPFESIVNRCLDSDPANRVTIDELSAIFSGPLPEASSSEADVPIVDEELPAPVISRRRRWLPFAVAGAVAGVALTLVAVKQEMPSHAAAVSEGAPPTSVKPDPAYPTGNQEADRVQTSGPRERIRTLVDTWVESIRQRDLEVQLQCYAPAIDTFYGRHHLDQTQLRAEKQRQFSSIGQIRNFSVSGVHIRQMNPDLAIVTFKKDWDFGGFAGSEQDELIVRPVNGQWKISSERGRKLNWVRRGRGNSDQSSG